MKKSELLNKLQFHVLYLRDKLVQATINTRTACLVLLYILADIDRYNERIVKLQLSLGLPVSIIDTTT